MCRKLKSCLSLQPSSTYREPYRDDVRRRLFMKGTYDIGMEQTLKVLVPMHV